MESLSRASVPAGALIGASAPLDPARAGIIHLGLGAFHRAHAAVHTARALAAEPGDWGIIGFAGRSRAVVDPMSRQDGLYSVLELSQTGRRAGVVDVHRGFATMAQEPDRVIAEIADPARRILTLTVSEGGYSRSARTGDLDVGRPMIREDLAAPDRPRSVIGMLARGLTERSTSGEPFTVLPCDNLPAAGATARRMVTEFLERSAASDDVLAYVREQVAFPNAMVDRIVPATTPQTSQEVAELLGVHDEAPVRAEEFTMWVIEDDFPGGRPAWEQAGVTFSDEVAGYEEVKLRILNGTHSLLAYLGALDGRTIIPAAWDQELIRAAGTAMIRRDCLPTIEVPAGLDVEEYIDSLSRRWQNHTLGHRTSQVGSDGSMRLPQRIPTPALHWLRRGRMPHLLALTVASWFAAVVPPTGYDPGPVAAAMTDPDQAMLRGIAEGARSPAEHARRLLASGCLSEEIAEQDAFIDRVGELLGIIVASGPLAAAQEAIEASETP